MCVDGWLLFKHDEWERAFISANNLAGCLPSERVISVEQDGQVLTAMPGVRDVESY